MQNDKISRAYCRTTSNAVIVPSTGTVCRLLQIFAKIIPKLAVKCALNAIKCGDVRQQELLTMLTTVNSIAYGNQRQRRYINERYFNRYSMN
jgi:hypothetical protein